MTGPTAKGVLLVTRNFPPLVGGAERLLEHVFQEIAARRPCDVVGPAGCEAWVQPPNRVHPCALTPLPWFLVASLYRAMLSCARRRYGTVISGSGVTALNALIAARLRGSTAVTFVHGLDLVAPHWLYRLVARWAIRRSDVVVANSRHTAGIARALGVAEERIVVLHPGVEPAGAAVERAVFERRFGLSPDHRVLLFVGRLVPRKGLSEFIERCLPAIVRRHPQVVLLVIGEEPTRALARQRQDLRSLRAVVARHQLESSVRFAGRASDESLRAAYTHAELHVFPLREVAGDVEGFGMVAVEAAAHGTPTVAFRLGGVIDAVAPGESGLLIEPGDDAGMIEAVVRSLDHPQLVASPGACRRFAERFSWPAFGESLNALCERADSA